MGSRGCPSAEKGDGARLALETCWSDSVAVAEEIGVGALLAASPVGGGAIPAGAASGGVEDECPATVENPKVVFQNADGERGDEVVALGIGGEDVGDVDGHLAEGDVL